MQSNKITSLFFALGKEVDGVPSYDEKISQALSFGAGNILLVLLICAKDAPSQYLLISRNIQRSGFCDVNLYSADYNNLLGVDLCPAYEKLLTDNHFVLGDIRNFTLFKRDHYTQAKKTFGVDEVKALANFLYLAAKSQGRPFEFSWASKQSGPVALFWLWHFSGIRKINFDNIGDAKTAPNRIIDKVSWIDSVFTRLHPGGPLLSMVFEEKMSDGQYRAKRCYLTGDVCQQPVRVLLKQGDSDQSVIYFEKERIDTLVRKLGATGKQGKLLRGNCSFDFPLYRDYSRWVTGVDRTASSALFQILKSFKKSFLLRFDSVQIEMPAKRAVDLHLVYYSIFEHFGFKRDILERNHLRVAPESHSACLVM